jgi:hypothetical protein
MKQSLMLLLLLTPFFSIAQPPRKGMHPDRERIESLEVGYLTKHLNLSPEDAQKFWPVFNKYRSDVKALNSNTAIIDPLDKQQKMLDIRKKYRTEFSKTLGQERGMKVYESEDDFRRMLKNAAHMRNRAKENQSPLMKKRMKEMEERKNK